MSHHGQLDSAEGRQLLGALRQACAKLPEFQEEVDGFGHTCFRVRGKSFVIVGMGEEGTAISIKCDRVNQGYLIRRGPYYRTPYIGQHGWISIYKPLDHDWQEVESLVTDAWLLAAPKRLAKAYDAAPESK